MSGWWIRWGQAALPLHGGGEGQAGGGVLLRYRPRSCWGNMTDSSSGRVPRRALCGLVGFDCPSQAWWLVVGELCASVPVFQSRCSRHQSPRLRRHRPACTGWQTWPSQSAESGCRACAAADEGQGRLHSMKRQCNAASKRRPRAQLVLLQPVRSHVS